MCRTKDSSVISCPPAQAFWKIVESKTASGLLIGSAVTPTKESNDDTVLSTRSPNNSPSSTISNGGASSDARIDTGIPALLPGVKTFTSTFSRNLAIRPSS